MARRYSRGAGVARFVVGWCKENGLYLRHIMTNSARQLTGVMPESSGTAGLFRTALAGPGHTLPDAFSNLERVPLVERVTRHFSCDLLAARIVLAADEGKGYWDFTRIRDEAY